DFGWMECDGRTLNASDYPELFKALGNSFGTTNIGATFKIPDLRGVFVRGWNHGSGADPEASSRGPADPSNPHPGWTGAQGDAVGSRQGDALLNHVHQIQGFHLEASGGNGFDGSGLDTNSNRNSGYTRLFNTTGSTAGTSQNETRPRNVALMYVIYTGKRPQ